MRRLPPLHALRAFEAAARHQSVTKAAEELGVSHSAVSQHIRTLEDHFGQLLFKRDGRRLELTDSARLFLEDVSSAFDRICLSAEHLRTGGVSTITVNATPSFAMRWLIPRSSRYQIENPHVRVVVETSQDDGIDHLTKSYDFVFRRGPMQKIDHDCRKVIDDAATALLSPSTAPSPASPEELRHSILLHIKSRPHAWRQWFGVCGIVIDAPSVGPFYDHFFLSLQAAINGLGVALGPLCLVEDDIRDNRLVAPFREWVLSGPGFHVMYPQAVVRSRHHRAFLEALVEEGRRQTEIVAAASLA
ncbi:LysR substrate-binding domain-containing protein [Microvirga sp. VF16]|uniref:LysR substrate-binding domain-containing protein n=1 Tax=Microvirga sp. VF16 TaxID=2807101 RepID=UPI00193E3FFD|nr:LysR substrate-binding domain-containing protein [Microvirga sp. VF16]QRM32397.1 LysR family transcriptional regulator [Microvirga sp. VF16]